MELEPAKTYFPTSRRRFGALYSFFYSSPPFPCPYCRGKSGKLRRRRRHCGRSLTARPVADVGGHVHSLSWSNLLRSPILSEVQSVTVKFSALTMDLWSLDAHGLALSTRFSLGAPRPFTKYMDHMKQFQIHINFQCRCRRCQAQALVLSCSLCKTWSPVPARS